MNPARVILSKAKDLGLALRAGSVRGLFSQYQMLRFVQHDMPINKNILKANEKDLEDHSRTFGPGTLTSPSHEGRLAGLGWVFWLVVRPTPHAFPFERRQRVTSAKQWLPVSFVPTHSGGTAGGLHPFPFRPSHRKIWRHFMAEPHAKSSGTRQIPTIDPQMKAA